MKQTKKTVGLLGGLTVLLLLFFISVPGLGAQGRRCLALSLCAVCWWATGVMNPGYTSLALLTGFCLLIDPSVAPRSAILNIWTTPTMYLVISGFLISAAVRASGIGKRLALIFLRRFVRGWNSLLASAYLLGLLLSFFIPHPWPRSFLLIGIVSEAARAAGVGKRYLPSLGLAVFAGSVPTAMVLLTGDSTLNPAVAGFAGVEVSYLDWLRHMGLPGLFASALTFSAHSLLFERPKDFSLDRDALSEQLRALGPVTPIEKKTLGILLAATVLWATDSLTGLSTGWVAALAAVALALPAVGALDAESWSNVSMSTLLFLTAALAIGSVGGATGMNAWVAKLLLPSALPKNPYLFALICAVICMLMHAALGSSLAVLGIAAPAIVSFGTNAGFPPLYAAMIAYIAVACHWLLPFHHMNLLVGLEDGGYSDRDVLRLGIPQTLIVLLTVLFATFWWQITGSL